VFYQACLDRIDILVTEKDSTVKKADVLEILRHLSYFRPKDAYTGDRVNEAMGGYS